MIDLTRLTHLKKQWEQRTDPQKDDLLDHLLKQAWPTLTGQKQ